MSTNHTVLLLIYHSTVINIGAQARLYKISPLVSEEIGSSLPEIYATPGD